MAQIVPLENLRSDEEGWISDVEGDRDLVHRLAEMGVRAGANVRMLQSGEPCIIHVNNQRLSLRMDQVTILVELAAPVSPAVQPAVQAADA